MFKVVGMVFVVVVIFMVGFDVYKKGFFVLICVCLNMNVLMSVVVIGVFLIG